MAWLPKGTLISIENRRLLVKLAKIFVIPAIGLLLFMIVPKVYPSLVSKNANLKVITFDRWDSAQTDADLQYLAAYYNVLVTDGYSYYNGKVAYLHQQNPSLQVLPYLNALVAVKNESDWAYINANHPDWFLKDASGNRVYEKSFPNNFLLNPNNVDWKAYRAQQLQDYTVAKGYDGVYLDVILPWINSGTIYYNAQPVNPATGGLFTNAEWKQANIGFLDSMKQAIGPAKTLMINGLSNGDTYYSWDVAAYMTKADAGLMEGFLRWGQQAASFNKTETEWKKDIDALSAVAQLGKKVYAMTAVYSDINATAEQMKAMHIYSLSSYLLVSGPTTGYSFLPPVAASVQPYEALWEISVGQPLSAYYALNNVYQRDFTDGKVLVNPTDSGQTFNVPLGGSYRTIDGQTVTSISLAPKSGTILTKVAGASAPIVSFSSPADGAVINGKVILSANASDDIGVTKVEFYIDGELDTTDAGAPYGTTCYLTYYAKGNHLISAKAYDAAGNSATATITVSVDSQVTSLTGYKAVLVKFKTGTSQTAITSLVQMFGLTSVKSNPAGWYTFTVPAGVSVAHMASLLLNQPIVQYAEINNKRNSFGDVNPTAVSSGDNAAPSVDQMLALDAPGLPVFESSQNDASTLAGSPAGIAAAKTLTHTAARARADNVKRVSAISTSSAATLLALLVLAFSSLIWKILTA